MGNTSSQTLRHFWPPSVFLQGPNSLQIIRIRAAGAGRSHSAGLVSEGRGNR